MVAKTNLKTLRWLSTITLKMRANQPLNMSESDVDTERTVVQTYIPAYQREEWDRHAEQLGMNRSEFVRSMVQAGRRGFGAETDDNTETDEGPSESTPSLEERIRAELATKPQSWDELLSEIAGDIETRLEETLTQMQARNQIRYSGREGGYVLEETP